MSWNKKKTFLLFTFLLFNPLSPQPFVSAVFDETFLPCFFTGALFGTLFDFESEEGRICEDVDCGAVGRCVENESGDAECICEDGYCGLSCQLSDALTGQDCNDGDVCETQGAMCIEGACRCDCDETFSGTFTPVSGITEPVSRCLTDCSSGLSNSFSTSRAPAANRDSERVLGSIATLADCQNACLTEATFECRSITYIMARQLCGLARTRQSEASLDTSLPNSEYQERICN